MLNDNHNITYTIMFFCEINREAETQGLALNALHLLVSNVFVKKELLFFMLYVFCSGVK
jgi:hypothetical protein